MHKIDAHQHFWIYDDREYSWISPAMSVLRRDFVPNDLADPLARCGLEGSIAVQARQNEQENEQLLDFAAKHDFVRGVVGWVDLRRVDIRAQLSELDGVEKLVGFRHIVQDEPDDEFLLRSDFCRGIEALGATRFRFDILIYPKQMHAATRFVERFPEIDFVLDHIAKPPFAKADSDEMRMWEERIYALAKASPKLRCKVSGLVTEADWHAWSDADFTAALQHVEAAFGRDRLMYGSDWPVCLLAADDYARVHRIVDSWTAAWSPAERAGFFGGVAADFYGLER